MNPTKLALQSQRILEEKGAPDVVAQTVARLVYVKTEKASKNQEIAEVNPQELDRLKEWLMG